MLFSRSHIRHLILILITFFFSQIQSAITVSLRYTVRNAGIKAVWCSSSFSSCSTLKRHKKKWYWRSATCLWLKRLTQLSDRGSRWWIEPWKGKKARNLSNSTQRTSGFAPSEKKVHIISRRNLSKASVLLTSGSSNVFQWQPIQKVLRRSP